MTLSDDRFEWQTVSAENIDLHWYRGEEVGPLLLDAAVEAQQRLETEMGITLTDDVDLWIYGDSGDMRDAVLYIQDWAGGVAFTEYNTILIGVPPNIADDWGVSTVAHELAHLVTGQFGRSCVGGSRPTWLEEGLATYAEGEIDAQTTQDIENALENNTFAPLRSLNGSFPAHGGAAGSAYSQSYSVVDYLLDTYGQAQMAALITTLATGESYDDALTDVYGFNTDGLETEWRTGDWRSAAHDSADADAGFGRSDSHHRPRSHCPIHADTRSLSNVRRRNGAATRRKRTRICSPFSRHWRFSPAAP